MRLTLIVIFNTWILTATLFASENSIFKWQASEDKQLYAPLGQKLPESLYLTDHGSIVLPTEFQGKPFVIAVRDPDCPISRKYSYYFEKLQPLDINVIFLLAGNLASQKIVLKDRARHSLKGHYIFDADAKLSQWLGVRTSSEVYLFDGQSRLRYRGAIDDQYGIGFSRLSAQQRFLEEALTSVNANLNVAVPATNAPGCIIETEAISNTSTTITWHNQVSRIFTSKCQLCHRPGQAGPFPLETYQQVSQRKAMIKFVLEKNIMPPWSNIEDGQRWLGERHLSKSDRKLLIDWIDAGAPEGDANDAAPAYTWASGWKYGEPDVVLKSPQVMTIPAEGEVDYRYVSIPTNFDEDKWVQVIEVATEAPQNTHHIILFVLPPEKLQEKYLPGAFRETVLSRKELHMLALRGFFSGYVPGLPGTSYPDGMAKLLPKGWRIVLQIHHQTNGREAEDRPSVGLQFSKRKFIKSVETLAATDVDLKIPAGTKRHLETAEYKFNNDGHIIGLYPHMHLRGSAFRYELIEPNGEKQILLDVPKYDPNWQLYYKINNPIEVKSGSVLFASAWFDNSKENLNNPDHNVDVRFGLRTRDEMLIGYFDWVGMIE